MMTREENICQSCAHSKVCKFNDGESSEYCNQHLALSALRPVSREQVEKVFPGCEKCRNQANWPSWIENGFVYCPKCGTPLTSWAWEKQVERLEALKDGKDRSI